jgi:hypothetical protein
MTRSDQWDECGEAAAPISNLKFQISKGGGELMDWQASERSGLFQIHVRSIDIIGSNLMLE